MSKHKPKEETTILLDEDKIEDHPPRMTLNEAYELLADCGIMIVPLFPEDYLVNAPSSELTH